MTYVYYKDAKGEWRWRLVAANGRILADSGEGYKSEKECKDDIDRVNASKEARSSKRNKHRARDRAIKTGGESSRSLAALPFGPFA
jgi:uncharacterized protein YegP (UPF0339 family)